MLQAPPHSDRRRQLALAVLCAQTLMIVLDQTIVNVALPSIRDDLGFSQAGIAWVVNVYLIPFGGLLLLTGRLGDLLGRGRVFLGGMALFTVASLACGLAWNAEILIAARFLQGVGGAASSAVVLSMIVGLFPVARERAKAIGAFSFVQAAGGSIGSVTGGVLTETVSWHWIFLINVPIGLLAGLGAVRVLDADEGLGVRAGADVLGAALVTVALMLGVYAIVELDGTRSPILGAASLVLLAAFLLRQARTTNPLVPLRLFGSRALSGANVVLLLMVAAAFGFQFLIVLYLRQVLGFSAEQAGLAMLPVALVIAVVSLFVSARVTHRFGERPVLLMGLLLTMVGLALLGRIRVDGSYVMDVLPTMLALGLGFGLALPALMTLGVSGAPPADSGLASGLFNTSQQVGSALGLSTLAALAASHTGSLEALTSGYRLAFLVAAALVATGAVVAGFVFAPRRGDATRR